MTTQDHNNKEFMSDAFQRILALEAELDSAYKQGHISARKFIKRNRALDKVKVKLKKSQLRQTFNNASTKEADFGLPNISDMNPNEITVCHAHINEYRKKIKSISKKVDRIYNWILSTLDGGMNPFNTPLRFSALKRISFEIQQLDNQKKLEQNSLSAVESRLFESGHLEEKNVDGTIRLFYQLNNKLNEVAGLKIRIANEEHSVLRMKNWLRENRHKRNRSAPKVSSPKMDHILATHQYVESLQDKRQLVEKRQKSLIEQYWNGVCAKETNENQNRYF